MQKRMLLVAVALIGAVAGKAQADYVLEGPLNKPNLIAPEWNGYANTLGEVSLPPSSDPRTTTWLWAPDVANEDAPSRYARISWMHNAAAVTTDTYGFGASASGRFRLNAVVVPAAIGYGEPASQSSSNFDGVKTQAVGSHPYGILANAWVAPDEEDVVNGVRGRRLRATVIAMIYDSAYNITQPDPNDPHAGMYIPRRSSVKFSERQVEVTNLILSETAIGQ